MKPETFYKILKSIKNHPKFRVNPIPQDVIDFGRTIAMLQKENWLKERIKFWIYAYDSDHVWTFKDWTYDITVEAWELAKKRNQDKIIARNRLKQHQPKEDETWDNVSDPETALRKIGKLHLWIELQQKLNSNQGSVNEQHFPETKMVKENS